MTELGWEWVWVRSSFFFCVFVVAHHCPYIHKKNEENCENEKPMPALEKNPLFSRKALVVEKIGMERLGS